MDKNSLSHTTWECKYHLVFAPKYRRQVIYGQIKADVAEILSMLCKRSLIGYSKNRKQVIAERGV